MCSSLSGETKASTAVKVERQKSLFLRKGKGEPFIFSNFWLLDEALLGQAGQPSSFHLLRKSHLKSLTRGSSVKFSQVSGHPVVKSGIPIKLILTILLTASEIK